jgi:hypothetical protein
MNGATVGRKSRASKMNERTDKRMGKRRISDEKLYEPTY